MIREQNDFVPQMGKGVTIKVVGMPMRNPRVMGVPDGLQLLLRDIVREGPAAKIRGARNPGIRDQYREAIMSRFSKCGRL